MQRAIVTIFALMNSLYRSFVAPVILASANLAVSTQAIAQTQGSSRSNTHKVLVSAEFQSPAQQEQQQKQLVIEGQLYSLLRGQQSDIPAEELRKVVENEITDRAKRAEYLKHLDKIQGKNVRSGYSDVPSINSSNPDTPHIQPESSSRLMVDPGDDVDSNASNLTYRSVTPNETISSPWRFPQSNFQEWPAKERWLESDMENSQIYNRERPTVSESLAKEAERHKEAAHHSSKMAAIFTTISIALLLQSATLLLAQRSFNKRLKKVQAEHEQQKTRQILYANDLASEINNLREERRILREQLAQKSALCDSYSVHNKRLGVIHDRLRTKIEQLEQEITLLEARIANLHKGDASNN